MANYIMCPTIISTCAHKTKEGYISTKTTADSFFSFFHAHDPQVENDDYRVSHTCYWESLMALPINIRDMVHVQRFLQLHVSLLCWIFHRRVMMSCMESFSNYFREVLFNLYD